MNQVKNMSLNEVHAYVREHDDDQLAMDSRVPRRRSIVIKQSIEGASVDIRGAATLPDATGGIADTDEADTTKDKLRSRSKIQDNDREEEVI